MARMDVMFDRAFKSIDAADKARRKREADFSAHLRRALNNTPAVVGAKQDPRRKHATLLVLTDDSDGHAYRVTIREEVGLVSKENGSWQWYENADAD